MTPEERQLLAGLFDRVKNAAGGERDKEAEEFIASAMKDSPHAGYVLSQAVIVQEEALKAAAAKIEELEGQVQELEEQAQNAAPAGGGGFLGGIGKSLFGGDQREESRRPSGPSGDRSFGQRSAAPSSRGSGISVPSRPGGPEGGPPGGSPWSHQRNAAPAAEQSGGGNSFLKGALGAAAGVAGGVLLANAIGGLMSGNNNPLGIGGAKAAESKDASDKSSGDDWEDDKSSGDDWEDDKSSGDDWEDDDEGDDWDDEDDDGDDWGDDGGDGGDWD